MALGQSTTRAIPGTWFRLDAIDDFAQCADLLMDIAYYGDITFSKDSSGNKTLILKAASSGTPGGAVNSIAASIGSVLRWDGAQLKKYDNRDAFLVENDVVT